MNKAFITIMEIIERDKGLFDGITGEFSCMSAVLGFRKYKLAFILAEYLELYTPWRNMDCKSFPKWNSYFVLRKSMTVG